jgi:hypothetical protein
LTYIYIYIYIYINHIDINHIDINHIDINLIDINLIDINHIDINYIDINYIDINHVDINHVDINHVDINHVDINHIDITKNRIDVYITKKLKYLYMCSIYNKKNTMTSYNPPVAFALDKMCPECARQANPRGADGAPRPHLPGCQNEQVPDFASLYLPCLECANQKKWETDFENGNVYCPGTPRVHTCGR